MIVAVKRVRDNPEEKNMGQQEQIHKLPLASQEELLGVEERRKKNKGAKSSQQGHDEEYAESSNSWSSVQVVL